MRASFFAFWFLLNRSRRNDPINTIIERARLAEYYIPLDESEKHKVEYEGRANEAELGCQHNVKSHEATVARTHKHDWLILLVLCVIQVVLYLIGPFYRFFRKDMMEVLKYPMKDNTIPVRAVRLYAVVLPIVIVILYYLRRRDVYDLRHSVLGLLFAVLISGVLHDAIKNAVG